MQYSHTVATTSPQSLIEKRITGHLKKVKEPRTLHQLICGIHFKDLDYLTPRAQNALVEEVVGQMVESGTVHMFRQDGETRVFSLRPKEHRSNRRRRKKSRDVQARLVPRPFGS